MNRCNPVYCLNRNAGLTGSFEGHKAPVTGVAVLASAEAAALSSVPDDGSLALGLGCPLFVTTGMDCSVRLWSVRDSPAYPLLAFEDRNEYFVDCDASPIHPALFATIDLSNCLDLWSLNTDHEAGYPLYLFHLSGLDLVNSFFPIGTDCYGTNRRRCFVETLSIPQKGPAFSRRW